MKPPLPAPRGRQPLPPPPPPPLLLPGASGPRRTRGGEGRQGRGEAVPPQAPSPQPQPGCPAAVAAPSPGSAPAAGAQPPPPAPAHPALVETAAGHRLPGKRHLQRVPAPASPASPGRNHPARKGVGGAGRAAGSGKGRGWQLCHPCAQRPPPPGSGTAGQCTTVPSGAEGRALPTRPAPPTPRRCGTGRQPGGGFSCPQQVGGAARRGAASGPARPGAAVRPLALRFPSLPVWSGRRGPVRAGRGRGARRALEAAACPCQGAVGRTREAAPVVSSGQLGRSPRPWARRCCCGPGPPRGLLLLGKSSPVPRCYPLRRLGGAGNVHRRIACVGARLL